MIQQKDFVCDSGIYEYLRFLDDGYSLLCVVDGFVEIVQDGFFEAFGLQKQYDKPNLLFDIPEKIGKVFFDLMRENKNSAHIENVKIFTFKVITKKNRKAYFFLVKKLN